MGDKILPLKVNGRFGDSASRIRPREHWHELMLARLLFYSCELVALRI
jgi:hypothetical protein